MLIVFFLYLLVQNVSARTVGLTLVKWNSTTYAVAHHVYFMYQLLERSQIWNPVMLMDDYFAPQFNIYGHQYNAQKIRNISNLDVIIEASASYPTNNLKQKYPHIKFVHFNQGPFYLSNAAFIGQNKEMPADINRRFDAIWLTPQYKWQAQYLSEYLRTDSWAITPYLWSPKRLAVKYNYQKGTANRVGTYETNRGVYKMSLVPIMIANRAFRRHVNISYYETPAVYRIWTDAFRKMINGLDIKVHAKPDLVEIPQHYSDKRIGTIVSHHLLNGLNYLHLEALYMNMSLVHNSEYIKECGYYYPGFDIEEGARVLRHAIETHDDNLQTYATASAKCLWKYAPENPVNLKLYENLLNDLF